VGQVGRGLIADRPDFSFDGDIWIVVDPAARRVTEFSGQQWNDVYVDAPYAPGGGGSSPYTPPPLASAFTWRQQGACTTADQTNQLFLDSGGQNDNQLHGKHLTIASPQTVTVAIHPFYISGQIVGMYLTDTGTGNATLWGIYTAPPQFVMQHFTGVGGSYVNIYGPSALWSGILPVHPLWLRVVSGATTISYQASWDNGVNFHEVTSENQTVPFPASLANAAGFGLVPVANANEIDLSLVSWKLT
jgi:hypothetical protein